MENKKSIDGIEIPNPDAEKFYFAAGINKTTADCCHEVCVSVGKCRGHL